jgi:hypothetical protein
MAITASCFIHNRAKQIDEIILAAVELPIKSNLATAKQSINTNWKPLIL